MILQSWDFPNETNLNINSKFDTLYEKVHETAIKHVPLKKVTPKQLKLRSKPWIDFHTQKLIKHRDRLLHKLRKTHCNTTEELYKKFRNRVVSDFTFYFPLFYFTFMITFNPTNLI